MFGDEKLFSFLTSAKHLCQSDLHFHLKKGLEGEIDLSFRNSAVKLTLSVYCKRVHDRMAQCCPCTPNLSALGF